MLCKALMLYSTNGLGFIVNILLIPILLHFVGFSGYGIYSIYISLSTMILFVDTAISKIIIGTALSPDAIKSKTLSTGWMAYLLQAIVLFVLSPLIALMGAYIFPLHIQGINFGFWVSLVAMLEYVLAIPGLFFQTVNVLEKKYGVYAQYQLFVLVSRFCFVVTTAWVSHDIRFIMVAILCRKPIDTAVAFYMWKKIHVFFHPPKNWRLALELWENALPIAGTSILQALSTEIFSIYINCVYGINILGRYRSIYDVLNKIWFIATLYPVLVYPRLRSWLADVQQKTFFISCYLRLNKFSIASYAAVALLIMIFYQIWISATQTYQAYPFLFSSILLGVFFSAHSRLGLELLQATGLARMGLFINVASLTFTLIILLAAHGRDLHEVEAAWIGGQFFLSFLVDSYGLKILGLSKRAAFFNGVWLIVILLASLLLVSMWLAFTLAILFFIWLLVKIFQNYKQLTLAVQYCQ